MRTKSAPRNPEYADEVDPYEQINTAQYHRFFKSVQHNATVPIVELVSYAVFNFQDVTECCNELIPRASRERLHAPRSDGLNLVEVLAHLDAVQELAETDGSGQLSYRAVQRLVDALILRADSEGTDFDLVLQARDERRPPRSLLQHPYDVTAHQAAIPGAILSSFMLHHIPLPFELIQIVIGYSVIRIMPLKNL